MFPRAFPLIASPGALSAVVLLTGRAEGWTEEASIILLIGLCLITTYIAMRTADFLVRLLRQTGADVVGRISVSSSQVGHAVHLRRLLSGWIAQSPQTLQARSATIAGSAARYRFAPMA